MPEIIPNSDIRLMFDVPLTSQYENTYYFHDEEQQLLYFENHFTSITYTDQYYTRKRRGWLRINDTYNRVYNANYLFFRNVSRQVDNIANPPYENKSYYAFIDDVVYINDHTCEVHYTIDVIQTYMFTWSFHQCIIERETTNSDNLYEHRIDEGLPVGDYIYSNGQRLSFRPLTQLSYSPLPLGFRPQVVIAATVNKNYEDTTDDAKITSDFGGIITGCQMVIPDPETSDTGWGVDTDSNIKGALKWLDKLPGEKQGAILGVYMVPLVFAENPQVTQFVASVNRGIYNSQLGTLNSQWAYTPKNKKLLSAPYNSLAIISSDGSSLVLDPSEFHDTTIDIRFYLDEVFTSPIQGVLYPAAYKRNTDNVSFTLSLPTMPSTTWSNDSYKAWAALNTGYMVSSMAGSIVDAGVKIGAAYFGGQAIEAAVSSAGAASAVSMPSNFIGSGLSGTDFITEPTPSANMARYNLQANTVKGVFGDIQNIVNNIITIQNARIQPDTFNGSAQNLSTIIKGNYGFSVVQRCIRPDYAEILDNYFTMFGYKVMRLGLPILRQRSRFTYIKTLNCDIGGNIPNIDKRLICDIFNSGIRFWDDRDNLGSYVNDNIPLLNQ